MRAKQKILDMAAVFSLVSPLLLGGCFAPNPNAENQPLLKSENGIFIKRVQVEGYVASVEITANQTECMQNLKLLRLSNYQMVMADHRELKPRYRQTVNRLFAAPSMIDLESKAPEAENLKRDCSGVGVNSPPLYLQGDEFFLRLKREFAPNPDKAGLPRHQTSAHKPQPPRAIS